MTKYQDLLMFLMGSLTIAFTSTQLSQCEQRTINISCDVRLVECRDYLKSIKGER